ALMLASAGLDRAAQKSAAEQPIWSGASAGYEIQWTTGDLTAVPARSLVGFSARQMARKEFADIEKDSDGHCTYDRTLKLLSVVGSIVSYQDDDFLTCEQAAHPSGGSRFVAIDLARPPVARRDLSDDPSLPRQL